MPPSADPSRRVIVVACAAVMFFCASTNFSHGVLLVALTETGLYDVNTVAWLLSITNLMTALGGPLGSVLVNKTSCRTTVIFSGLTACLGYVFSSCTWDIRIIFISYGILTGLARGVAISATTVSIGYWFKENSSLGSGLMYAGVGVGMLVHPRLLRALVDQYDADGALLMMGAIAFHTCACGLLLRPASFETERKCIWKQQQPQISFTISIRNSFHHFKTNILTNYSFMSFVLGVSQVIMAFQIIITFMPDFFQFHGSTPQESAMVASVMGSGSLVSRILTGIIANDPKIGTMLLFQGNCGISAIFTLLLPLMVECVVGRYIYAAVIGIYLTCMFVLLGPTTFEKVGIENLAPGFGFIYLNTAVVSLIGPPLAVQVKILTDSYYSVFVLAGSLLFGACGCGLLSEMLKKTEQEDQNNPALKAILTTTTCTEENADTDCARTCNERLSSNVSITKISFKVTDL